MFANSLKKVNKRDSPNYPWVRPRFLKVSILVLILQFQVVNLNRQRAEEFYAEHEGKFFYNR